MAVPAGDTARALALLERSVDVGHYVHSWITRVCPYYTTLREAPGFERVAAKAAVRVASFDAAMGQ